MCEQRERVLDYLYDEASAASRQEMQQHLLTCDECRDEIRGLRSVRDDLLAWAVPHQPSVWTPFAPAPVAPWYRQMPAWAMAAAAALMMTLGATGVFAAYTLGGRGEDGVATSQAEATSAPALDAKAMSEIETLVRQYLASAGVGTAQPTPVPAASPAAFRLDPATEQRLLARANERVGVSEERQWSLIRGYLTEVAVEADRQRRLDGQELTVLRNKVDQLQAIVGQLVINQTKVQ